MVILLKMREIKFKVGTKAPSGKLYWKYFTLWTENGNGKLEQVFEENYDTPWLQWTGIKDKNGKGIYEGDILYCEGIGNMEVSFRNGAFCLDNGIEIMYFCEDQERDIDMNILGNVYENPELMEDESRIKK